MSAMADAAVVGTAEHQDLDQLLEDEPVGDARAVASERVVSVVVGKEGLELLPDRLDNIWWESGHRACSFCSGSVENSPDDGATVPALHAKALPESTTY